MLSCEGEYSKSYCGVLKMILSRRCVNWFVLWIAVHLWSWLCSNSMRKRICLNRRKMKKEQRRIIGIKEIIVPQEMVASKMNHHRRKSVWLVRSKSKKRERYFLNWKCCIFCFGWNSTKQKRQVEVCAGRIEGTASDESALICVQGIFDVL